MSTTRLRLGRRRLARLRRALRRRPPVIRWAWGGREIPHPWGQYDGELGPDDPRIFPNF